MIREFIIIVCLAVIFYILYFRAFILRRKKFRCLRCGHCCRLLVKLSKKDIQRLKANNEKKFMDKKTYLKKINGYCKFLIIKNGKATCSIYSYRPDICKSWPLKNFWVDLRCRYFSGKLF